METATQESIEFSIDLALIKILNQIYDQLPPASKSQCIKISALLQNNLKDNIQTNIQNVSGSLMEKYFFQVHYYFVQIYNLQDLIKIMDGQDMELIQLKTCKNNLFTFNYLYDKIQRNTVKEALKHVKIKSNVLGKLKVRIGEGEQGEEAVFSLTQKRLEHCERASGKLDAHQLAQICAFYNNVHKDLQLTPMFLSEVNIDIAQKMIERMAVLKVKETCKVKITEEIYSDAVNKMTDPKITEDQQVKIMKEVKSMVIESVFVQDQGNLDWLEKLLIALLGHEQEFVRNCSIQYLNLIYDRVDWVLRGGYIPRIQTVNEEFKIEYVIEKSPKNLEGENFLLILNSLPFDSKSQISNVISFHYPKIQLEQVGEKTFFKFDYQFDNFPRTGFYDWKLVRISSTGAFRTVMSQPGGFNKSQTLRDPLDGSQQDGLPVQQRVIVHPSEARALQIHEVLVDRSDLDQDQQSKDYGVLDETKPIKLCNFKDFTYQLPEYKQHNINCLYLLGVHERGIPEYQKTENDPGNPLAVVSRTLPYRQLGSQEDFKDLVDTANSNNIRIVTDCLTRVSSYQLMRKNKPHLLKKVTKDGKIITFYGAEGRSANYEDTVLLNYRKKEVWDTLVNETISFAQQYGLHGIHCDYAETWPQLWARDLKELNRVECDGNPAYTKEEIFQGDIILSEEQCGYWQSSFSNHYCNPFFVKLCKKLWQMFPDFLIIGEEWGSQAQAKRQRVFINSGLIPRSYQIPFALGRVFGEDISLDGKIKHCQPSSVNQLRHWYQDQKKSLPDGSIIIQSTTSHSLPYPALIFKRGAWSVIDMFFFLPDIPMTFMGEQTGGVYRTKILDVYFPVTVDQDEESEHPESPSPNKSFKRSTSQSSFHSFLNEQQTPRSQQQISPQRAQTARSGIRKTPSTERISLMTSRSISHKKLNQLLKMMKKQKIPVTHRINGRMIRALDLASQFNSQKNKYLNPHNPSEFQNEEIKEEYKQEEQEFNSQQSIIFPMQKGISQMFPKEISVPEEQFQIQESPHPNQTSTKFQEEEEKSEGYGGQTSSIDKFSSKKKDYQNHQIQVFDIPSIKSLESPSSKQGMRQHLISYFDNLTFIINDICPNCKRNLFAEEIIEGWPRSYNEYTTQCPIPNCRKVFVAKLKIMKYEGYQKKRKSVSFLNPILIKKEIQNLIEHKGIKEFQKDDFEDKHRPIFWNMLFGFSLIDAPIYFLDKNKNPEFIQQNVILLERTISYYQIKSSQRRESIFNKIFSKKKSNVLKPQHSIFSLGFHSPPLITPPSSKKKKSNKKQFKSKKQKNYAQKEVKNIFGPLLSTLKERFQQKLTDLEKLRTQQGIAYYSNVSSCKSWSQFTSTPMNEQFSNTGTPSDYTQQSDNVSQISEFSNSTAKKK